MWSEIPLYPHTSTQWLTTGGGVGRGSLIYFYFKLEHLKKYPLPRLELLMENLETFLNFGFDHIEYPLSQTPKLKLPMENLWCTLLYSGRLPSR